MRMVSDTVKNRLLDRPVLCSVRCGCTAPSGLKHLRGHVPAVADPLNAVGRLEADHELKLAIGLPLRNREELTNILERIYDPASPEYRQLLDPGAVCGRFSPTAEDYRAVTAFARANGLKVTGTHSNRTLLDVAGSVSNIEKTFHVTMQAYQHPRENREFYAPDVEPSLEIGTVTAGFAHRRLGQLPPAASDEPDQSRCCNPGFSRRRYRQRFRIFRRPLSWADDFRAAYVPGMALTGAGQTVGLLEFDGYYPGDIAAYASMAGLTAVPLTNVWLDGFSGVPGQNNSGSGSWISTWPPAWRRGFGVGDRL